MGKQSLARRIQNAVQAGDPRGRYKQIKGDFPQECAQLERALGPLPVADLDDAPLDKAVSYAARDADCTCRIAPVLGRAHSDLGLERVEEIDLAAIPFYERIHRNGILVDRQHFQDLAVYLSALMEMKS